VTTTNPESFTLDSVSNIASRTGPTATYTYDTSNRLTGDGSQTFSWSNADRLTGRGSDTFGYDPLDRLTSSTVSGTSRTYIYNADGLLQSRTQGGSTTNLLWDPATSPSRLLQIGSDKIIYGLGPLYVVVGSGTSTFARDGGKSVRVELSGSGAVTASFRYRAYGPIAQSSGASNPTYLGYAGQLIDASGLYYMRARWYDPESSRFVSADPIAGSSSNPRALNAFAYAFAAPIQLTDPSGAWPCPELCAEIQMPVITLPSLDGIAALLASASRAIPFVGVAIFVASVPDNPRDNDEDRIYSVYELVNEADEVVYVGMTKRGIDERFQEHRLDPRKVGKFINYHPVAENLTRLEARAVEQVRIEEHGLDNLLNRINSIAESNPLYPMRHALSNDLLRAAGF
jgi:RHS repeat-associated protein